MQFSKIFRRCCADNRFSLVSLRTTEKKKLSFPLSNQGKVRDRPFPHPTISCVGIYLVLSLLQPSNLLRDSTDIPPSLPTPPPPYSVARQPAPTHLHPSSPFSRTASWVLPGLAVSTRPPQPPARTRERPPQRESPWADGVAEEAKGATTPSTTARLFWFRNGAGGRGYERRQNHRTFPKQLSQRRLKDALEIGATHRGGMCHRTTVSAVYVCLTKAVAYVNTRPVCPPGGLRNREGSRLSSPGNMTEVVPLGDR